MKRNLVLLMLCAATVGGAPARDSGTLPIKRLSLGEIGGWIEVEVRAGGQSSRWLLDTGSTRHIVSRAWAETQRLDPGATVQAATALGSLPGREVSLPTLHLGTHEHTGQSALMVDDLGVLVGAAGEGLDGILGLPLLRGVTLDLDLARWTLVIGEQSSADCPLGTEAVALSSHRGLPVIGLRINEGEVEEMVLDTGNPSAVVRLSDNTSTTEEPGLWLPGGQVQLALADRISVGGWQREQVPVMRLRAPSLRRALARRIAGLAGTALLDGTRWRIDLERAQACVSGTATRLPGGFGLTLIWRDGALWIDSVLDGGPAQAAGLQAGDRVLTWAGGAATRPLRELWSQVQAEPELVVGMGAEGRPVTLRRAYFLPRLP